MNTEAITEQVVNALREKDWQHRYLVMDMNGGVVGIFENTVGVVYSDATYAPLDTVNDLTGEVETNAKWYFLDSTRTTTRDLVYHALEAGKIAVVSHPYTNERRLVFKVPANCYFYEVRTHEPKPQVYELDAMVGWLYRNDAYFKTEDGDSSMEYGVVLARHLLRGVAFQFHISEELLSPIVGEETDVERYIRNRQTVYSLRRGEVVIVPVMGERRHYMAYPYMDIEMLQRATPEKETTDGTKATTSNEGGNEEP